MSETEPLYDPEVFNCASEFMNWQENNCKNCAYWDNCALPPPTEQSRHKTGTIRKSLCVEMPYI